jgi:hypothetical protein
MSIQVLHRGDSSVKFPDITQQHTATTALKLYMIFYSVLAQTLVGYFETQALDTDLWNVHAQGAYKVGLFARIWRNGSRMEWTSERHETGIYSLANFHPYIASTDDGRFAWAPDQKVGGTLARPGDSLILQAQGNSPAKYYRVNDLWGNDIHTGQPMGQHAWLSNSFVGYLRPGAETGYNLTTRRNYDGGSSSKPMVVEQPSGTIVWEGPEGGLAPFQYYSHAREIHFIDSETSAILFLNVSTGTTIDYTKPAIIRVYTTNVVPWKLEWEDVLPGTCNIAAYDQPNKLLYCMNKFPDQDPMHTCRLKKAPVSISVPVIVSGGSKLDENTKTDLSVTVLDSFGSTISNYLVSWYLSNSVSGGRLLSNYSLTNNSGVATITYVGPHKPPGGLTENITAAVNDVEG